jgi:hypothetical protein
MKKTQIARELVAIANELDAAGNTAAADKVDAVLEQTAAEPDAKQLVASAIEGAEKSGYLANILDQRNPSSPNRLGSFFVEDQSASSLKSANWKPYSHKDIIPPAKGYVADIPGTVGMIGLNTLPPDMIITASDPKGTHGTKGGGYSVEVPLDPSKLPQASQTTAIIGPGQNKEDPLALWTIFPGTPFEGVIVGTHELSPIQAKNPEKFDTSTGSFQLTVQEALDQGFKYGKVALK